MLLSSLFAAVSVALFGLANGAFVSFSSSSSSAIDSERVRYDGHQVLRVVPKSATELRKLHEATEDSNLGLDVWSESMEYMDIRVPPVSMEAFRKLGFDFSVYVEDVQALIDNEVVSSSSDLDADFFASYHTLPEIVAFIDDLAKKYPSIVQPVSIGKTYQGNEIVGIRIGKPSSGSKKEYVLHGGIHAREWISTATVTYIANELVTKYGTNSTITSLVDNVDWTIFPVLNPDGFIYTHTKDRMWRKNRQPTTSASCIGIDPNRNFGYMWAQGGSSSSPCNEAYHGSKAFEALETLNIYNYIKSRSNVVAYTDLHAYSQLFMYPLGASCSQKIADAAELKTVAQAAVNGLTALYGTKYKVGDICNTIYQASGSSVDTIYMNANVKFSYAVELRDTGSYGFNLPASQIIPTGRETAEAIFYIGNYISKK